MLVDSHCHLDRLDLAAHGGSLDAALDAARARGVGQFLCIGVSADNAQAVKALAERYADVHCSVGVHPLDLEPEARQRWTGCWANWRIRGWWRSARPASTTTTNRKPPSCNRRRFACTWKPRGSPPSQ